MPPYTDELGKNNRKDYMFAVESYCEQDCHWRQWQAELMIPGGTPLPAVPNQEPIDRPSVYEAACDEVAEVIDAVFDYLAEVADEYETYIFARAWQREWCEEGDCEELNPVTTDVYMEIRPRTEDFPPRVIVWDEDPWAKEIIVFPDPGEEVYPQDLWDDYHNDNQASLPNPKIVNGYGGLD